MNQIKIGFSLPHMGSLATAENIAYAARFGETEGFDSLWVIDRILWPAEPQTPYPPSPDGSWPEIYQNVIDPIETLTYVAGITQKIKLATGIYKLIFLFIEILLIYYQVMSRSYKNNFA